VSTTTQHWEPGARVLGRCHCGGSLMLVEDDGPPLPIEAQCATCRELTGLARAAVVDDVVQSGSPEDLGF